MMTVNTNGDGDLAPAIGTSVRVCSLGATGNPCFPLETLYTNSSLTTVQPLNPFTADSYGNITVCTKSSTVYLQTTYKGVTNNQPTYLIGPGGGGGGAGSVTSVGLTGNTSLFSITGSPITSSGTMNIDMPPQNATYALMGPPLSANPIPPSIVQSKICTVATGTSIGCTFTNPTQAGSLIIVGPPYHSTAVTDNLGQAYLNSPNFPLTSVFYKENTAAGVTTVTTTVAGPGAAVVILEVSQIATSGSLDQDLYNVGNITGTNTPITFGQVSTSNPADFILGYWTCPVNSSTVPTASPGWTLGGYQAASGNGPSGGFVWQNGTSVMAFRPTVATADCAQQQSSMTLAFKASLVGSAGPLTFRPVQSSDLPNRPWSSITNPPDGFLLQLNMGKGASIFNWNIAGTGNNQTDLGFGWQFIDTSTTSPACTNFPLPDTPTCRYLISATSNQAGVWPLQVNATGAPGHTTNYVPGFHVSGANGNIVMQANSTIQIPSIVSAPLLGTDANGNIILGTGGTGGSPQVVIGNNTTTPLIVKSPDLNTSLTFTMANATNPTFTSSTGQVNLPTLVVGDLAGTGTVCVQANATGNLQRTTAGCGGSLVPWSSITDATASTTFNTSGFRTEIFQNHDINASAGLKLTDTGSTANAAGMFVLETQTNGGNVNPFEASTPTGTVTINGQGNILLGTGSTLIGPVRLPITSAASLATDPAGNIIVGTGGPSGGGGGGANPSFPFTSVTSLSILGTSHKLNTGNLIVNCYDGSSPNNKIDPQSITVNPITYDVAVTFAVAQTGRCVVNGSGPALYTAPLASATSWTISASTHNLGAHPILGALIDANGYRVQPGSFNHDASGNVTITVSVAAAYTVELTN